MTATRRSADADRAPLEEQRDFLLRSLEDLEREHDAGDIDEHDYEALRDDYTVRAAAVLRALDAHAALADRGGAPEASGRDVGSRASSPSPCLAGIGVALTSGRRDAGSVASGDPSRGAAENIARADQLMSEDKLEEAIVAYTQSARRTNRRMYAR